MSVLAPGGYGKTVTLALWDRADWREFAWAHLDRGDDDPAHLLRHLAAAVHAAAHSTTTEHDAYLAEEDFDLDERIVRLILLLESATPFVLVLDGFDHPLSLASAAVIERVTEGIPIGSHMVIAGRAARPLPLTRRRLHGEVFDLTMADLALSDDQGRRLLRLTGLDTGDDEVVGLLHRAEGWADGLALFARSGDTEAMARDYLEEEVMAPLSGPAQRFLESTSVLDVVTAEAADELLSTTTSARMIDDLIDQGTVVLVPLEHAPMSYRHHRFFEPLLKERLARHDPSAAMALQRRASEICERRDDLAGAVRLAVTAGDGARAADLVLKRAVPLVFSGAIEDLCGLLDLLPDDAPERWPAAAVATGWCGVGLGDAAMIGRAWGTLTRDPDVGPLVDGSLSVAAAVALMRAILAPDGVPGVVRDAELVRRAGDRARNPYWGLATFVQGTAHSMLGEDDLARARFAEAYPTISNLPMFEAGTLSHLAVLDLRAGDLTTAHKRAANGLRIAERHHLESLAPAVTIYAVAAMLAARTGHRDDAHAAAAIAIPVLEGFDPLAARTALICHLCLADAALHLDDRVQTREHLHLAMAARRRDPTATRLNQDLDDLLARFEDGANAGRPDSDRLTPAEMKVLAYLPTHLSLAQIAEDLNVSHSTAKSQSVAIYRKLGVSKRGDAVYAAQQLGILPPGSSTTPPR